jgi:hypothetical protein
MDQNKFINTYIDIVVANLVEQIKTNLQLQTQVKVHEFVVADKEQIIASLSQQLNENRIAEDWKVKYESAESNYNAILGKLKHMDTLLAQVNDMKNIIIEKDSQIAVLKSEIEELKFPKKVINTKVKKKEESLLVVQDKPTKNPLDDF